VNGTTAFKPSFMYNAGRIISYTVIGAFVGGVGSVISLTGNFQGILKLIAGVLMVIMGMNMLGIFPQLRRFQITLPKFFTKKVIGQKNKTKNPFLVGLLNGFMPCGPLQAMQIYALSTGSVLLGGLSMFLFSIGTFPLMFAIGAFSTLLSKKFTKTFMKIGATLVVLLGFSMLSQGWLLSGFQSQLNTFLPAGLTQKTSGGGTIRSLPGSEPVQNAAAATESVMEDGKQVLTTTLSGYSFPNVTVKSGTPVEWHFKAPKGSIAGCNNSVSMDYFGVQKFLHDGDNVITFTPEDKGNFDYTCSMGMITGTITVI
jgi:sulfite exporter TauE/SafE/plastocyanin